MNRTSHHTKVFLPLVLGFCVGLFVHFKTSSHLNECKDDIIGEKESKLVHSEDKIKREAQPTSRPSTVKAKPSRFNNDYRPYFVYSELGFKDMVFVGVKITEKQLISFGISINNTWSQDLQSVVFFTPYSNNEEFHNRFVKNMNLNIVQLPDIVNTSTDVEFSLRILQYMRDHYLNRFYWFLMVDSNVYVNALNLVEFFKSLNSTREIVISSDTESRQDCDTRSGIIFSHAALSKFTAQSCSSNSGLLNTIISDCLSKQFFLKCTPANLFYNHRKMNLQKQIENNEELKNALTMSPMKSITEMLSIHKYFINTRLDSQFDETYSLQSSIKQFHSRLPDDVIEKKLRWPLGYPRPFKPSSRFEVIQWTYFDKKQMYGYSDTEPVSVFPSANFKDLSEILQTVKRAIQQKHSNRNLKFDLVNGYHRVDPRRGAEYVIDMRVQLSSRDIGKIHRYQLLRPFSRVEPLAMPAATEQKGIHLVLPIMKDDISQFEKFLQMYKRICLQTGENVVLLTVFVNIRRGRFEGEDKDDPFVDFKNLIARYKQSYMWAQLPWLQVGVKKISDVLIMDIVSMKLPSNALIFHLTHDTHFTVNFLNRCRVNVINGIQVFFPISFAEYDPDIVFADKQKPAFSDVHITTGTWGRSVNQVGCFSNNDYKDVRMWKKDFLDEGIPSNQTILNLFQGSNLRVFRAIDSELHTRFSLTECDSSSKENITQCNLKNAERLGNRGQLAQILFQNKWEP